MKTGLLTFLLLAAIAPGLRADELLLHSGKTVTGRITSETEKSYTIRLGPNMYLGVGKDEVSRVTRSKPPAKPSRPVYQYQEPKTDKDDKAAKPADVPAPVANAREFTSTETVKIGATVVEKATRFRTYDVTGPSFESARRAILDDASGKGFREGRRRSPSRTEWQASWTGEPGAKGASWKSVVVRATMTVTLPAWRAKGDVPEADAGQWAAFLKEATTHEAGHLEIIHDALMSFGESATNLTAGDEADLKSETTALFKAIQAQAAKRRQGYERRERRQPIPIKKKR